MGRVWSSAATFLLRVVARSRGDVLVATRRGFAEIARNDTLNLPQNDIRRQVAIHVALPGGHILPIKVTCKTALVQPSTAPRSLARTHHKHLEIEYHGEGDIVAVI